jgi:hypothetical protein
MYLWKYWRESRIAFGVSMLCVVLLAWLVFKGVWHIDDPGHSGRPDQATIAKMLMVSLYLQVPVSAFLAWVMGSFGVGRDLGEGSGSYLLTRPRRRRWFLWHDWGFGFLQLVWTIVLVNLLIGYLVHRLLGAGGQPAQRLDHAARHGLAGACGGDHRTELPDHRSFRRAHLRRHGLLNYCREARTRSHAGSGHHSWLSRSGCPDASLLAGYRASQTCYAGVPDLARVE